MRSMKGFTLVEILVALFVFTILSVLLVSALHQVIQQQAQTEYHAERLRQLQMAMLILSRDVEQTVNRPELLPNNKKEPTFIGLPEAVTFTHAGSQTWQRVRYQVMQQQLQRISLEGKPHTRVLLGEVEAIQFEYLDKQDHFVTHWPIAGDKDQLLPRAIRVILTIKSWGTLSQLYVIPAENIKKIT